MAAETGSARQEAERLVATVLAMAAGAAPGGPVRGRDDDTLADTGRGRDDDTLADTGRGRDDETLADTGARLVEGLGTLGDTVAGLVSRVAGAAGGRHADTGGGSGSPAAPGEGSGGGHGSPAATAYGWATGSIECCVCPVCRMIATLRNPTPEAAERLATGAGDFATGVAGLMRAVSALSGSRPRPARPPRPAAPPDPDVAWSAATRTGRAEPDPDPTPDEGCSPWAAATRAAAREQQAAARAQARADKPRVDEPQAQARAAEPRAEAPTGAATGGGSGAVAGAGEAPPPAGRGGGRRGNPASRTAPRTGERFDVWAAATGDVGVPGGRGVDDAAPGRGDRADQTEPDGVEQ